MGEFWQAVIGATVAYILGAAIRAISSARAGRENSKKESFDEVLSTDNLQALGTYFSTKFGKVPISSYVRSEDTRNSVNKILARLSEYVDPPAEEPAQVEPSPAPVKKGAKSRVGAQTSLKSLLEPVEGDPPALKLAIQSVTGGDEWSGLARVRRDLERQIQQRMPTSSRLPPYRLLQMLEPPPAVHAEFREFSKIANAAVHGTDVEPINALQALERARAVYAWLDTLPVADQMVSKSASVDD